MIEISNRKIRETAASEGCFEFRILHFAFVGKPGLIFDFVTADFDIRISNFRPKAGQTSPWSIMASATFRKPAMFAPFT